jgi:hypothetical protein
VIPRELFYRVLDRLFDLIFTHDDIVNVHIFIGDPSFYSIEIPTGGFARLGSFLIRKEIQFCGGAL